MRTTYSLYEKNDFILSSVIKITNTAYDIVNTKLSCLLKESAGFYTQLTLINLKQILFGLNE
jgi:hypothetical protein